MALPAAAEDEGPASRVQAGGSRGLQPQHAGTCRVQADAEHIPSTSCQRRVGGADVMGSTGKLSPPQFASLSLRVFKGYLRAFRYV